MKLQIMGKVIEGGEGITGDQVKKVGFMIMDKNTDPFEMHIADLKPYGDGVQERNKLNHILNQGVTSIFPLSKYPKINFKERESQLWEKMEMGATRYLFWEE